MLEVFFREKTKQNTKFMLTVLDGKVALSWLVFLNTPLITAATRIPKTNNVAPLIKACQSSLLSLEAKSDAGSACFFRITSASLPFLSVDFIHLSSQIISFWFSWSVISACNMHLICTASFLWSRVCSPASSGVALFPWSCFKTPSPLSFHLTIFYILVVVLITV